MGDQIRMYSLIVYWLKFLIRVNDNYLEMFVYVKGES